MKSRREVEIKIGLESLGVNNVAALRRRLRSLGFRITHARRREVNWIYDDGQQSLRRTGRLLRLRRSGRDWLLTAKGPSDAQSRHKSREEAETAVLNGECCARMLHLLGYSEQFVYERFRTDLKRGPGEIVIDETPIGTFIELEGPPQWIDRTARALGVAESDYITKSYVELFYTYAQAHGLKARNMTFNELIPTRDQQDPSKH
jgi:adenylate cyclase class 2